MGSAFGGLLSYLQVGKSEDRFDKPFLRIQKVIKIALLQSKLLREPLAGFMHLAIFWGFLSLIAAVVESIGEGITGHFSFRFLGRFYSAVTFTQEIFCVLVVVAVMLALWRRFISRVKRLQAGTHGNADAAVILRLDFPHCIDTGFAKRGAHLARGVSRRSQVPGIVDGGGVVLRKRFYCRMGPRVLVDAYRPYPRFPELSSVLKASSRADIDPECVFFQHEIPRGVEADRSQR